MRSAVIEQTIRQNSTALIRMVKFFMALSVQIQEPDSRKKHNGLIEFSCTRLFIFKLGIHP